MLLNKAQKDQIAEDNFSLVFYVVKMFQNSGVSYDELVSIAVVGYAKALNAFDSDRNVKFSTYAINCIKNEILFFLRKEKIHMKNDISLGAILSVDKSGNNLYLEDVVSEDDVFDNKLEDSVVLSDDINFLYKAIEMLSPKEVYIITYRYGLDKGIIKTQKDIALNLNMSQANISKMEKSAIDKIKKLLGEKISCNWKIKGVTNLYV